MAVETTFISLPLSVMLTSILAVNRHVMASVCPPHVTKIPRSYTASHNHICYLFINKELYWNEARDKCWDLGGEMLYIDSQETMDFIKKKLNSPELSWDREGVWLGATKINGRWSWTNGRVLNYTNWAPGQPSKLLGFLSVEDCSQMRQDDGWQWHDVPCGPFNFHYNYVCQFPLNRPGDVAGRVSSSASDQTEDNGNAVILAIIISVSTGLLLIMGIIFLVLYLHQRRNKEKAESTVHFSNNTYHSSPIRPSVPDTRAPAIPTSQVPFSSNEELYLDPQQDDKIRDHMLSNSFPQKRCRCNHNKMETTSSVCSSPGMDSELGACGGSDPERELTVPLMDSSNKTNSELVGANSAGHAPLHNCCSFSEGEYMDMNIAQGEKKGRHVKEEDLKHTYNNVDHRDSGIDNLYEALP